MRLFVSGATATLRRHPDSPYLGTLVVPAAGNRTDRLAAAGLPWAADNAAFTGFDPVAFCRMLGRIAGLPECRFVACPDVFGDAATTLARFAVWAPVIRALGLPVGLVAQDGLERLPVPWGEIDALFVGGGTDWKLGPGTAALAREAKRLGKWVHFGRCNTLRRFRHAYHLGCDSVDGSGFSRWPDQRVPAALRWLRELHGDAEGPPPDAATAAFFRGGLAAGTRAGPGWALQRVTSTPAGYEVHARFHAEPDGCPRCGRAVPEETRLYRHVTRVCRVRDEPRHGRPVTVVVTRPRFRCAACGHTFAPGPAGVHPGCRLTDAAVALLAGGGAAAPAGPPLRGGRPHGPAGPQPGRAVGAVTASRLRSQVAPVRPRLAETRGSPEH